jgi:hypothetical protein
MKLATIILEDQNKVDQLAAALGSEFKTLAKGIDTEFDKADDPKEGMITTASLVVALPAILGIIARLGRNASKLVRQYFGDKPEDPSAAEKYFQDMGKLADQLHHLYVRPIEAIVHKFVKDPKKAHNISNAIFHVIVAIFLIASGVTAVKALQAKNISLASLEGALTAVKGGEVKEYLSKFFA